MNVHFGSHESFKVEDFAAVYAHTEQTWQDPQRAQTYHNILSKVLKPQVHFGVGAEDRIGQEIKNGALCAIALTHGSAFDPVHIAAMVSQNTVFEPLIGRTMIGAKVSLFRAPVVGKIVPDLGAVPVWRKKDVLKDTHTPDVRERLEKIRKKAGEAFIRTEISGMNSGHHMAKHVEGTRNKDNPLQILTVRDGFGRVVCGVNKNKNILMIAAAFYYGKGSNKSIRKPTMYLDVPAKQNRNEPDEVTRTISRALQHSLDCAATLHQV